MSLFLESLKLLSDSTRLRILLLLDQEEVSVAELQEILNMKQSRISTQLGLLKINPEYAGLSNDDSAYMNTGFGFSAGFRF